jgi:hypothetical protein
MSNSYKIVVLLFILTLHTLLLYFLVHMKPAKWVAAAYNSLPKTTPETITVLELITRPRRAINNKAPESAQKNMALATSGMQAEFRDKEPSASVDQTNASAPDAGVAPLNLSLPDIKLDFSPKPRGLLEKPRNPIEYKTTRFNDSWKPQGSAMDSLKWKSKTVNTVLGLFGGNRKLCTDEDKKNSIAGCVPDGYRPENDSSLPIQ